MSPLLILLEMNGKDDLDLAKTIPATWSSIRGFENVLKRMLTALKYDTIYFLALVALKPSFLKRV